MTNTDSGTLAVLILLTFAWRFARTRQLYLTSLRVSQLGLPAPVLDPHDMRSVAQQVLLGRRSIKPASFFMRAVVLVLVAACLLPFKHYAPCLWWLVVALIGLYVPWCLAHGLMLRRHLDHGSGQRAA